MATIGDRETGCAPALCRVEASCNNHLAYQRRRASNSGRQSSIAPSVKASAGDQVALHIGFQKGVSRRLCLCRLRTGSSRAVPTAGVDGSLSHARRTRRSCKAMRDRGGGLATRSGSAFDPEGSQTVAHLRGYEAPSGYSKANGEVGQPVRIDTPQMSALVRIAILNRTSSTIR